MITQGHPASARPESRLSQRPSEGSRSGFTLIELLTVIAIIGILAAILVPTVGAVRRSAYKAQCASNLRQLGVAVNLFRNDNKNRLPDGQGVDGVGSDNNVDLQRIGANLRDTLIGKIGAPKSGYGLTWEMLFCNGNTSYTKTWMTDAQRTSTSTSIPVGYLYLPGTTVSIATAQGTSTSIYQRLAEPLGYRLLAADVNRQFNGSWSGGVNHSNDENVLGGNHLYIDGSVKWVEGSAFSTTPALTSGANKYYFKTEDLR